MLLASFVRRPCFLLWHLKLAFTIGLAISGAVSTVQEVADRCCRELPLSHTLQSRCCTAKLSRRNRSYFFFRAPQPFSFALRPMCDGLGLVELDEQLSKILHHRVPRRSSPRKCGVGRNRGRRIHRRSRGSLDCFLSRPKAAPTRSLTPELSSLSQSPIPDPLNRDW